MKRTLWTLALLLAASSMTLACDSDGDDGGSGASGGSDSGEGGASACFFNIECVADDGVGGQSMAACVNDGDCSLVESGDARSTATDCVLKPDCTSGSTEEQVQCVADCIAEADGMSDSCSTCYAGSALCTKNECLGECLADPTSCECFNCQKDSGCRQDFFDCSGLVDPTL